jgi:hypothetical protein
VNLRADIACVLKKKRKTKQSKERKGKEGRKESWNWVEEWKRQGSSETFLFLHHCFVYHLYMKEYK